MKFSNLIKNILVDLGYIDTAKNNVMKFSDISKEDFQILIKQAESYVSLLKELYLSHNINADLPNFTPEVLKLGRKNNSEIEDVLWDFFKSEISSSKENAKRVKKQEEEERKYEKEHPRKYNEFGNDYTIEIDAYGNKYKNYINHEMGQ